MKAKIARALTAEYDALRLQNESQRDQRVAQAAALDPRIAQLRAAKLTLFLDQVRAVMQGPQQVEEISANTLRKVAEIEQEIHEILDTHGLPDDHLELRYRCPICQDTGVVGEPIRHECACFTQQVISRMYEAGNLMEHQRQSFKTFDLNIFPEDIPQGTKQTQRARMEILRDLCMRYAQSFPTPDKPNMLFVGESGLGKTFLLNCIAAHIVSKGYVALRLTAFQLLQIMRDVHMGKGSLDDVLNCDLLIIDDLGTEPLLENVTIVYLFNILNERMAKRLATLTATNLSLDELKGRYTERVMSRLLDVPSTTMLRFYGRDVRIQKTAKGKTVNPKKEEYP